MHMDVREESILGFVANAISKNPAVAGGELFELAQEFDPSVGALSRRQFHAKYVLQLKKGLRTRSAPRRSKARGSDRMTTQAMGIRRLLETHIDARKRDLARSIDAVQQKAVSEGDLRTIEVLARELEKINARLGRLRAATG
jgi:hypothetical protein